MFLAWVSHILSERIVLLSSIYRHLIFLERVLSVFSLLLRSRAFCPSTHNHTHFYFLISLPFPMNISHFRKVLAGLSVSAMVLTQAGTILAYRDVPSGIWYEAAVNDFVDAGYLDSSQARFRGGDNALRAEFVKLVVELNGGILGTAPSSPSFSDVPVGAWYYGYMEEAGAEGWVKGDGNCYGTTPCYARPGAKINRAEAAALINRAFGLVGTSDAP